MNKHQIFTYLEYGKLINEINDIITIRIIKNDMIKFLKNFPERLLHPAKIFQQPYCECFGMPAECAINGGFLFHYSYKNRINFDGNNNFQRVAQIKNDWISINEVEHYVNNHINDFYDIIVQS